MKTLEKALPWQVCWLLVPLLLLPFPPCLPADEVVEVCSEPVLRAALEKGGLVSLACNGTITLTNTLVITNAVTLDASGHQVTLTTGRDIPLFRVEAQGDLSLIELRLVGGRATGTAGADGSAGSRVGKAGSAGRGGALLNAGGVVWIQNCLFRNNIAQGGDGGHGFAAVECDEAGDGGTGGAGLGGAICQLDGSLFLENSTFRNNSSLGGQGGDGGVAGSCGFGADGGRGRSGGIAHGGAVYVAGGLVEIENCSFFQNIAEGGTGGQGGNGVGGLGRGGDGGDGGAARGAGLFVALGEVYLNSSTLAHEECRRGLPGGGGLGGGSTNLDGDDGNPGAWLGECLARTGGSLHVSNTLLDGIRRLRNCSGTVSDQGHNLSSDASCGFDDTGFNAIDPLLQSSADITDATEVLELLPGSPAIDAADPTTAAALDQLGTDRVGPPDIGALEFVMALIEVSVTQIATEVVEGKSEEYLEICRTGPLDRIVKVNFTLGGTAVPSTDYALSGTGLSSNAMTFSTGAECSQIDITTHSDGKVAPAKTASLELADGTYHIGFPRTALMLILETNLPLITTTLAQEDRFTFGFHSLTSQLYQVEWSTNLIHWSDLAELQGSPDSNSLTYFTDPDSSLDRPKFYRIRVD